MLVEEFRKKLVQLAAKHGFLDREVRVELKPLSSKEAIGTPERDDFPLLKGKERLVEAQVAEGRGQAFTDAFSEYSGTLKELLELDIADRFNCSLMVAAGNAMLRALAMVGATLHCRDTAPGECALMLPGWIKEHYPDVKRIALVGLQPAMAEALSGKFELRILDLDEDNIGSRRHGVTIEDGSQALGEAAQWADMILATGSSITNHSIDGIIAAAGDKPLVFFGVTIAGAAELLGLKRYCPLGR